MPRKSDEKPSDAPGRERNTSAKRAGWRRRLKMLSPVILVAIVAAGLMLIGGGRPARSNPLAQSAPQTAPDPAGTIDGAKNPELIPDEFAWRMVFLAVAEPENATEAQKARARAKINPAGLSEDDATAFLALLTDFRKGLDGINSQAAEIFTRSRFPHPASTDYQLLLGLEKQRDQLVANTIAALPVRLSAQGWAQVQAYVQEAKRGMKLVPASPMPGK